MNANVVKRIALNSMVAVAVLAVAAPAAVTAASQSRDTPGDSALDRSILSSGRALEPIRLGCEVRATDAGPAVRCRWSEPSSPVAASVRLFRYDPDVDRHRGLVYRSENLGHTAFTDTRVRAGHRYAYVVQTYDAGGRVVGRSRAEWVRIPRIDDAAVELLRLACAPGDAGEWVGCEWSRPVSVDAAVVSLWRSVDGGGRELVEQFRPEGPNVYRDAVPQGAGSITYAVVATSGSDRVVARSRPVTVRIPGVTDVPEVTVQPSDRAPVGERAAVAITGAGGPALPGADPVGAVAPASSVVAVPRPADARAVGVTSP